MFPNEISSASRPSNQQMKEVFTIRKKTGPYDIIPLEIKLKLISEFGKVLFLGFSF